MQRMVKWLKRMAMGIAVLIVLVVSGVYAGSEVIFRRHYTDVALAAPPVVSADQASLAEGDRKAHILGCYGCHGRALEGRLFFSEKGVANLVAPNLTRVAATSSDAELERAIRHGVRRDGTGLFAMPSSAFYHLSERDLASLIALVRHQPRVEGYTGTTSLGPLGRVGLVTGRFKAVPAAMDHTAARVPADTSGDPTALGRYLAQVACSECHGPTLTGGLDGRAPTLAIATAYDDEQFRHLMRTGEPLMNRPLYLMSDAARGRFVHFTDEEVTSLHAYLRARFAPPAPPAE